MMDMKHPMFSAMVLLITAAHCVASDKIDVNSKGGDSNNFQTYVSKSRAKRLSLFPVVGHGGHLYPAETIDDGVDSVSDRAGTWSFPCQFVPADVKTRDEFVSRGSSHNNKRHSNFIRIGRSPVSVNNHQDRFRRASKLYRSGRDTSKFARNILYPCDILSTGRNTNSVPFGPNSGANIAGYTDYDESGLSESDLGGSDSDLSFPSLRNSIDKDNDMKKRVSSFVRIGKSLDDKRASHFVRIGKSESDYDDKVKRGSSFVRIGKSGLVTDMDHESSKRSSTFLRIGKMAPLESFKSLPYYLDDSSDSFSDDARFIKRGSSFVRIGRSPKKQRS